MVVLFEIYEVRNPSTINILNAAANLCCSDLWLYDTSKFKDAWF